MADRHTGRAFDPYTSDCKNNKFRQKNGLKRMKKHPFAACLATA